MRPERWWSFILAMALLLALSPLSAQAGPNRPVAMQQNRQAFTPFQPNGNAYGSYGQNRQGQQPYGNAYGSYGQNRQWQQPYGNAYGSYGQNRQWQQPYGNAYGSYGQNRQWVDHRNDYWRDDHRHHWWDEHRHDYWRDDQHRDAYGWNNHQNQWQQPRPAFVQGNGLGNRQFQSPNGTSYNRAGYSAQGQSPNTATGSAGYGQQYNSGSSYNRAGYSAQGQSPNTATGSSGYYHTTTTPVSQTGSQSGSQSQVASPAGTI